VFKSGTVNRISKMRIYRTVLKAVVMYGCETWPLTEKDEVKLNVEDKIILRKLYGPII
jgi:hypothetical protein